jgi:hypothetical protein
MSKTNKFKKGEMISAKKFSGESFLGIYELEYDCGDHCIFDGNKKFCVKHNTVKKATPEEENIIKETIIKPMREEKKRKALEELKKKQEEELEEEDVETLASEPTEEELEEAFESSETNEEE